MENLVGQLAALCAAGFWAVATLLYHRAGHHFSPVQLNLVKGVIATPLLLLFAYFGGSALVAFDNTPGVLLLISGVIGITIGDSCYFAALRRLGPWYAMLLEYLAPPLAAALAWIALGDTLGPWQLIGSTVTLMGVLTVVIEKPNGERQRLSLSGVLFGISAAACQAVGLVMSFHALQSFEVSAANAALLRLFAGTAALSIMIIAWRPRLLPETLHAFRKVSVLPLLLAVIFGTFLAIWLQQQAIARINPGLAQTLLATAPLFMLPIAWWQQQTPSLRSISGAIIALAGIGLLFLTPS
ncbi:EamA family transporter [Idiomarina tyrosinivorans]|uniref:EamA family transporter n=1 Tax=Idiomarina tyrosinivorans TaxID=1445662 RepID=A0A432ZU54_9GAMM|nr:DMT family transporter [Idiomarina tyrosinivorans]RUO81413.1 EamA family transporter [Idiomarina tyrosinivorans]